MPTQLFLFGSLFSSHLSIHEASRELNVSEATIRNWTKSGELTLENGKGITRESCNYFQHNIAGKKKLTNKANKSSLDHHSHLNLTTSVKEKLQNGADLLDIANHYENSISNSYRNKEGVYYTTPESVVQYFLVYQYRCQIKPFVTHAAEVGTSLSKLLLTALGQRMSLALILTPLPLK